MCSKRIVAALWIASIPGLAAVSVSSTVMIPRDNSGHPIPIFSNGYTIFFDRDPARVSAYDRSGVLILQASLSLGDGSRIVIRDAAAAPDGRLVIAGSALSSSQQLAAVMLWVGQGGQIERIVRTSPFFASHIALTSDGTLWAAGKVGDAELKDTQTHDILRQYDQQGRQVRAALSTSSFVSSSWHPCARCFLAVNSSYAGLYSGSANEFIEYDSSGAQIGRWRTPPIPENVSITGSALTPAGDLYISGFTNEGGYKLLVYRFDKRSSQFLPVDIPGDIGSSRPLTILGSDGDQLVFYGKPTGLTWLKLE